MVTTKQPKIVNPPPTPLSIEADAVAALAEARRALRESLEGLIREASADLRRLEGGRDVEPRLADDAVRVEVRAAKVRERLAALEAIQVLRRFVDAPHG